MVLALSGLMFFMLPWFYMKSGQLQPVDSVIFLLFFSLLALGQFFRLLPVLSYAKIYKTFLILSFYIITVTLVNCIIDLSNVPLMFVMQNIYYSYLVTVFLLMTLYLYYKYDDKKFYQMFLWFLLLETIIPLCFLLISGAGDGRGKLSYNNPNQLGFAALVNLSLLTYITLFAKERGLVLKKWLSIAVANANMLFLFLSVSRGAFPAILLYIFSQLILFRFKIQGDTIKIVKIFGTILAFIAIFFVGYELFHYMKGTGIAVSSTEYTRVEKDFFLRVIDGLDFNSLTVWMFFFGNGLNGTELRNGMEFHNNFVAFFSQVGIVGLLLYLYLNIIVIKELLKKGVIYFMPYACYLFFSFFHYSYRNRLNWLFLAVVIFILMYDHIPKKNHRYTAIQPQ